MQRIVNEENYWDHNVDGDGVGGPEDHASRNGVHV